MAAPDGVVIVSQTCDVVQDRVSYVHVAKLVSLDEQAARQARTGRRIRYVSLPALGDTFFADIAHIAPVHKSVVAAYERSCGLDTDESMSRFGKAVGRNFSRFALPDPVSIWLNPLADWIQSKAKSLTSAEGRMLDQVLQLRIQAVGGWASSPYDLRLLIVVRPEALPTFPDDHLPPFEEQLQSWLYDHEQLIRQPPGVIAERIEATQEPSDRYYLWAGLGDAWTAKCKFKGADQEVHGGSILDITSEVLTADQFTLTMQANSELLDLDHLSVSRTAD